MISVRTVFVGLTNRSWTRALTFLEVSGDGELWDASLISVARKFLHFLTFSCISCRWLENNYYVFEKKEIKKSYSSGSLGLFTVSETWRPKGHIPQVLINILRIFLSADVEAGFKIKKKCAGLNPGEKRTDLSLINTGEWNDFDW